MLKLRPFKKEDLELINGWLSKRDIESFLISDLPEIGYIAGECAAGFLYKTDSNMALIEGLVADSSSEEVGEALDIVITALMCRAKLEGFTKVVGMTSIQAVAGRAARLGFSEHTKSYRMLTLKV